MPTTASAKGWRPQDAWTRRSARYEEAIKRAEADKDPLLDIFRAHRDAARQKIAERRNWNCAGTEVPALDPP